MLLLIAIKKAMGQIVKHKIMLIPIFILLLRMFGIGILTYDNLWFYFLIIMVLSMNESQVTIRDAER